MTAVGPRVFPPGSPEPPADVYMVLDERRFAWDWVDRSTHLWRRSGHPEPEPRRTWTELNRHQTLTEVR